MIKECKHDFKAQTNTPTLSKNSRFTCVTVHVSFPFFGRWLQASLAQRAVYVTDTAGYVKRKAFAFVRCVTK